MSAIEQKHSALSKAWAVREGRGRRRRALAAGECRLADALRDPHCRRMRLPALLVWQPWWGSVRARKALATIESAGIKASLRVGELTPKQQLLVVMICLSHEPQRVQKLQAIAA